MSDARLVLDTCGLLWLAAGRKDLSSRALDSIEKASVVYVSAISGWEIGLKASRRALVLPLPAEEWFERVMANHHLTLAPLDPEILFASTRLPPHHNDPADRMIIATAMLKNAAVVTADARFKKYGLRTIV